MEADQVHRFGKFTLDERQGTLAAAGRPLALRPKAHSMLLHLARNIGRVVPKSELMDVVWPSIYVTEDSLTQSIREIRKVLGDDGQELVRTVTRRGYMLSADAETSIETSSQPVVAVLRFLNEGKDRSLEPVVDGFAEDIISGLARSGSMTVLARNSSFQYSSYATHEWSEMVSRMGAGYLVEGSVRWSARAAQISVNLVDLKNQHQLWGERYEASDLEVFSVQRDIAEQVINRLVTRVDAESLRRSAVKPASSLAAYELTMRAAAEMRGSNYHHTQTAISDLKAAIAQDPAYGLAYCYLALASLTKGGYARASQEVLNNALMLAAKGTALAPMLSIGPRVMSLVRTFLRQHAGAEADLRKALALNPCDADAVEQMGYLLTLRGRPVEALGWIERAKRLNPLYPDWYHYDQALALYCLGEYQQAAEALEQGRLVQPWLEARLAGCYAQMGNTMQAKRHVQNALAMRHGFDPVEDTIRYMPMERPSDLAHMVEGIQLATAISDS